MVLTTLHVLTYLILTANLAARYYGYPCFMDGETEAKII